MTVEILNIVVNWAIPCLLGAIVAFFSSKFTVGKKRLKSFSIGLQCLLRADILDQYKKWVDAGYCPIHEKQALEKEYTAYHSLGKNGVMTSAYQQIMDLPDHPVCHDIKTESGR